MTGDIQPLKHGLEVVYNLDGTMGLRAALAAQPAEPVAWVSADSPPTEKQEYVHDLLVRNKYGNVDIGTYDGYAKYFEVGNSTRLGGWPVVEWMFLPQTIIEGSKP